jgi:hypothetical protein
MLSSAQNNHPPASPEERRFLRTIQLILAGELTDHKQQPHFEGLHWDRLLDWLILVWHADKANSVWQAFEQLHHHVPFLAAWRPELRRRHTKLEHIRQQYMQQLNMTAQEALHHKNLLERYLLPMEDEAMDEEHIIPENEENEPALSHADQAIPETPDHTIQQQGLPLDEGGDAPRRSVPWNHWSLAENSVGVRFESLAHEAYNEARKRGEDGEDNVNRRFLQILMELELVETLDDDVLTRWNVDQFPDLFEDDAEPEEDRLEEIQGTLDGMVAEGTLKTVRREGDPEVRYTLSDAAWAKYANKPHDLLDDIYRLTPKGWELYFSQHEFSWRKRLPTGPGPGTLYSGFEEEDLFPGNEVFLQKKYLSYDRLYETFEEQHDKIEFDMVWDSLDANQIEYEDLTPLEQFTLLNASTYPSEYPHEYEYIDCWLRKVRAARARGGEAVPHWKRTKASDYLDLRMMRHLIYADYLYLVPPAWEHTTHADEMCAAPVSNPPALATTPVAEAVPDTPEPSDLATKLNEIEAELDTLLQRDPDAFELAMRAAQTVQAGKKALSSDQPSTHGVILSTLTPGRIEWLWKGRLALGKITILEGDPGLGKSALTLDLAARLTRGDCMPDGTPLPGSCRSRQKMMRQIPSCLACNAWGP